MKAAETQTFESYDLVALPFSDPEQEAQYIVETMKSLHGVAFKEDEGERGLDWSDMTVLLRSVAKSGDPILQALKRSAVPFVIVGMNNLFDSSEANAARTLFYFMASREGVTEETLRASWLAADLGLEPAALDQTIANATQNRVGFDDPVTGMRFSNYSIQRHFQSFLEDAGLLEEKIAGLRNRGEVVLYNLGKFSQLISDFETIHHKSKSKDKYDNFANFLQYRAESYYPEGSADHAYARPNAGRCLQMASFGNFFYARTPAFKMACRSRPGMWWRAGSG